MKSCLSRRSGATVAVLLGVSLLSLSARAQDNGQPLLPSPQSPSVFNATVPNFFENLQPVTPEVVAPAPALYRVEFPVRNVRPSLVAYWVDPARPTPIDLQLSEMSNGGAGPHSQLLADRAKASKPLPRLPGNANGPEGVKLPEGVTRIVAVDSRNALIVSGSKEGLKALSVLLPTLDVPLVQYEIEAQFLQVDRADLSKLGVDFGDRPKQPSYSFGAVAMASPAIARFAAGVHVKVLSAPRITALDGLTAQLQQTTATPFVLTTPVAKAEGEEARIEESVAYLTTTIGVRATPVRLKEDLISLSVTPMLSTRSLSVTATIHDGQSFAIQMSPAQDETQIVVFVTARRIRRMG